MSARVSGKVIAVLSLLAAPWAQGADLLQIYQQALQSDPQLREAEANRLAAREAKPIALADLLPQLNATGSVGHDEASGRQAVIVTQATTVPYKTNSDTTQYQIQLRQAVFHWDQWVALHRASASVARCGEKLALKRKIPSPGR